MTTISDRLPCCATWDGNELLAETPLMRAVLDGYPVVPGHALIVPKRHVNRLGHLYWRELQDLSFLVAVVQRESDAKHFTIGINEGELAGRTVPHLHVHVIPRRAGDVPDPRGGVRQLFVAPEQDPWINRRGAWSTSCSPPAIATPTPAGSSAPRGASPRG